MDAIKQTVTNLQQEPNNEKLAKLGKANNNDEDFANINQTNTSRTPESGRASRSSAFSSTFDSDELDLSSSSGRSSADQQQPQVSEKEDSPKVGARSNLIPEHDLVIRIVEEVRCSFLEWCKSEDAFDLFEPLDLAEMQKPIPNGGLDREQSMAYRWISRYFNFQQLISEPPSQEKLQKDIAQALESVKELLKFRNDLQLSHAKAEDFAKEFYLLSGIFQFGQDKQGIPVLYLRARVHRRWTSKLDNSFRRYLAWQIDQLTKSCPGSEANKTAGTSSTVKDGSFGICFDCLNVSYACLDMDFLRYLVKVLVQFYPSYCRYALSVDLPWLFRSVWKLVKSWLPEEAQNSVFLITSKQLIDFIELDQIPNSQKVNDLKANQKPASCRHQLPANINSIPSLADRAQELELSSNELKQIKSHVDKVIKEYEQLGAI